MVIYELSLYVVAQKIQREYPGFIQTLYYDKLTPVGSCHNIKPSIFRIDALGDVCGFLLELDKSQLMQAT